MGGCGAWLRHAICKQTMFVGHYRISPFPEVPLLPPRSAAPHGHCCIGLGLRKGSQTDNQIGAPLCPRNRPPIIFRRQFGYHMLFWGILFRLAAHGRQSAMHYEVSRVWGQFGYNSVVFGYRLGCLFGYQLGCLFGYQFGFLLGRLWSASGRNHTIRGAFLFRLPSLAAPGCQPHITPQANMSLVVGVRPWITALVTGVSVLLWRL